MSGFQGRRRRPAVAVFASIVCGLIVGPSALAGDTPAQGVNPRSGEPLPTGGSVLDAAVLRAREEEAEIRSERATPSAERERKDSRDAFEDLTSGEAFALARREAGRSETRPIDAPDNVEKFINSNVAVIDPVGTKRMALVTSTLPLRDRNESGKLEEVSTALTAPAGQPLEPDNALADYRISRRATTGVLFDDAGFGLRHAGADPDAQMLMSDDEAFFADVDPDVDFMVASLPEGVQTFHTLRSPEAPERIALQFTLPVGGRLTTRTAPAPLSAPTSDAMRTRYVAVMKGDRQVGVVSTPIAWDAQQRPVPVDFDVTGDQLVMRVEHRDRELAYPITLDPYVFEDQPFQTGSAPARLAPASTATSGASDAPVSCGPTGPP